MAYYTNLIAGWNSVTQPPAGVTGTAITGGMTTQQKLTAVNGWTIAGPTAAAIVPSYKIYNAVVPSEFQGLSAGNQQLVRDIFGQGDVDGSPGGNAATVLAQVFGAATTTRANLLALQNTFKTTIPWWQSAGYARAFDLGDVAAAGLS